MKISTFFKILNKKIERYDKIASNPFERPQPIILIWVEDYVNKPFDEEKKDYF